MNDSYLVFVNDDNFEKILGVANENID